MLYDVSVTEDHIKSDKYVSTKHCMFGLAMHERFPDNKIDVGVGDCWINDVHLTLPKEVCTAINRWIHGKVVQPFVAKLNIPDSVPLNLQGAL